MGLPDYLIPPTPLQIAHRRLWASCDSLIGLEITRDDAAALLKELAKLKLRILSRARKPDDP